MEAVAIIEIEKVWVAIAVVLCAVLAACTKWLNMKEKAARQALLGEVAAAVMVGIGIFALHMEKGFSVWVACIASLLLGFAAVEVVSFLSRYAIARAKKKLGADDDRKE